MKNRRRGHFEDDPHLERWLISYADYMTLMFALFVVLYAFSMAKKENYRYLSDSLANLFHFSQPAAREAVGADLLLSDSNLSEIEQYRPGVLEAPGSVPVEGEAQLVNIDKPLAGTPFSSMKEQLNNNLLELINEGYASIVEQDEWLIIELSSGLIFASGSATPRQNTLALLRQISITLATANNFIRVRGYTDNQPINNEVFKSNWQLSVARATAVVEQLQLLGIAPQRLAIEGYGQYWPKVPNTTASGRANNRRVVIALSRQGWQETTVEAPVRDDVALSTEGEKPLPDENTIQIIELPNGGIRITTRKEN